MYLNLGYSLFILLLLWLLNANSGLLPQGCLTLLAHRQVAAQANGEVVDDLHNAQNGHAHEQPEQATTVGKEVGLAVQLRSLGRDELGLLEEDRETRQLDSAKVQQNY